MTRIPAHLQIDSRPQASPDAIIQGPMVRFTVLTNRLLRLEFDPANRFEDRPSQAFWYREQPVPAFTKHVDDQTITIETDALRLEYQITPAGFTADTLRITLKQTGTTWHYGAPDTGNLRGTTRTLDQVSGATPLKPGLLSRDGWAVVDDSETLVFNDQSWLEGRDAHPAALDLYFFGYGHDYGACLRDYASPHRPVFHCCRAGRWATGGAASGSTARKNSPP
jgi:hypothetical protein